MSKMVHGIHLTMHAEALHYELSHPKKKSVVALAMKGFSMARRSRIRHVPKQMLLQETKGSLEMKVS